MIHSTEKPWPLSGWPRLVLRLIWVFIFLFLVYSYAVGFSNALDYARRGVMGISYDKTEGGTIVVMAVVKGGPAEQAGIKPGDKLFQVNGHVVRADTEESELSSWLGGAIGTTVDLRIRDAGNQLRSITIALGKSLPDVVIAYAEFAQSCLFLIAGLLIFWKRPGSGYMLFVSLGLILLTFSLATFPVFDAFQAQVMTALGLVIALFIVLTYPNGSLFPFWSILIGFFGVIFYGLLLFPAPLNPYAWPNEIAAVAQWSLFGAGIACQAYRYRRIANPIEQRQLRWALGGAVITFVVYVVSGIIFLLPIARDWFYINQPMHILHDVILTLGYLAAPIALVIPIFLKEAE
jgi:hypothetical protein